MHATPTNMRVPAPVTESVIGCIVPALNYRVHSDNVTLHVDSTWPPRLNRARSIPKRRTP